MHVCKKNPKSQRTNYLERVEKTVTGTHTGKKIVPVPKRQSGKFPNSGDMR
jgi:hypothetical protein